MRRLACYLQDVWSIVLGHMIFVLLDTREQKSNAVLRDIRRRIAAKPLRTLHRRSGLVEAGLGQVVAVLKRQPWGLDVSVSALTHPEVRPGENLSAGGGAARPDTK